MGTITGLLSGPLKGIIDSVGGVLDKLSTSSEEKLDAHRALVAIERAFQLEVIKADVSFAETQASVIIAEAKSESWIARSWRPMLMLTFTYIVAHNYIIAPIFGIVSVPIPNDLWDLLKIGMGGYIAGRSIEKAAPAITEAIVAGKRK